MDVDYKVILWCVYVGILIAALYTTYQKSVIGRLVHALFEKGCHSPETALTLAELGLADHKLIRNALKPKSTVSNLVSSVSESENGSAPAKNGFDFSLARFYVSPEKKEKAARYEADGSSLLTLLFAVIGGLIIVLLGHLLVPYLTSLFTELLS